MNILIPIIGSVLIIATAFSPRLSFPAKVAVVAAIVVITNLIK